MARWLLFVAALVLATAAPAAATPRCYGPYTINSNNYAPGPNGDAVFDWVGDFTVNMILTTGTVTVAVEGKLPGGDFVSLGSMSTSALPQFHGPIEKLRFSPSACNKTCVAGANSGATCTVDSQCPSSTCGFACLATIVVCANPE